MKQFHPLLLGLTIVVVIMALTLNTPVPAAADPGPCTSGAHTLSKFGDRVYPEMGNGGYTSVHSDIYIVYDAATNMFLPGTHVDLTQQATQCLTDFSLDFERTSANVTDGPNMAVDSVTVDGQPATFTFVQPTYPGDPNGQDDPDPLAHAVSNVNPVSATNPNPPACSPQVDDDSQNGQQCPANKLVITPSAPIPAGSTFIVTVNYTGRPGVYNDGDGTTEGWFRSNNPVGDGAFVTTEPVGTMAWMPLNNHPSAKPTVDVYDTVNAGKTAISAGELVSTQANPPDSNFPGGSVTWHWRSPEHVASYLLTNSIGNFDLAQATVDGIKYYWAVPSSITAARKAQDKAVTDQQPGITQFQAQFNGPFPFTSNGVVIGLPSASFAEEMQTKITFPNGANRTPSVGTLAHENMHQWFGDNVSEAAFNLTFWKEGWATVGEYLNTARTAANNAGGLGTPAGNAAFDNSLINRFNTNYGTTSQSAWTSAPSNPTVGNLFSTFSTYTRPGTAYLALRQILDASASRSASDRWIGVMKQIQSQYGGGVITEPQLVAVFHQWLPNQSEGCHALLDQFFTQWFDTAYPTPNNATNKPQITGPGINGPNHFYDDSSACTRADQTITFGALPNRSPGDPDFTVSASSDSGLPVSFSAAGQCTVADTTVHITGPGSCTITASQAGDLVFKPATPVLQTFAIGPDVTNDAPGGTVSVQYSDSLNPTVTISASDAAAHGSTFTATATGLPEGLSLAIDSTSDDSTLPGTRTWKVVGATTAAPGQYLVTVTVTDDTGRHNSTSFTINVTQEDARAAYNGNGLFWTSSVNSTDANVTLSAAILDASALATTDPAYDPNPGDIRNAMVTFVNRDTNTAFPGCSNLPVGLVNAGDLKTGVATCNTTLTADNSGGTQYTVGIVVSGYYTRNSSEDDAIITMAQPIPSNFITGGGYLVLSSSAGLVPGTAGSKTHFGFNLKYNKSGTNLQGNINIIMRSGGRVYQIKGNAISSLGVRNNTANFTGKANIQDITDPNNPISIDGNTTLQMWMTDNGEPGSGDTLGIQVLNKSGGMWFSSNWNGVKTVEQNLGGGNLAVH